MDIIVTTTNSLTPVFLDTLKPGVHVNVVGPLRPLPSQVISSIDKVVVESKEVALEEVGYLQIPIQEGAFKESDIHAELGQIISGERTGREKNQENTVFTVFKSVGLALLRMGGN